MSTNVIISNRSDVSTNEIIDWIEYLGGSFNRFNGENFIDGTLVDIRLNDSELNFNLGNWSGGNNLKNRVWFRRFFPYDYYEDLKTNLTENGADIITNVFSEINTVFKFALNEEFNYSNQGKRSVNKLEALNIARKVGLKIPNTLITTAKAKVIKFKEENGSIIMKPLSDSLSFRSVGFSGAVYTTEINDDQLSELDEQFFVSLFQERLDKLFEIRTFYFDSKIYSMAIFSQQNDKTSIDFRKYDDSKPNRTVPYSLPPLIEDKIKVLMNELKLESGSIDIVRTKDGRFVFLEVNPVGQFGMVSYPCNYQLEQIIAKKICEI